MFMDFNELTKTAFINASATNEDLIGSYLIEVELNDLSLNETENKYSALKYNFTLAIVDGFNSTADYEYASLALEFNSIENLDIDTLLEMTYDWYL